MTPGLLRRFDRGLLALCLVALGATVAYPTLRLLVAALADWNLSAVTGGAGRQAVWNTLGMAFASVLTSGLVGSAMAFFIWRYRFPGRRILGALAYLPFALPPLVGTLSFYYLIGPDLGVVPRFAQIRLGLDDFNFTGPLAILVIHTYSFSVYFYAMVSAALEGLDVSQIEAARTLGANRWLTLRRVTLPMLRPALAGAAVLAFMTSGASFSAPLFFGDNFPYLSVEIYTQRSQGNAASAMTLSVVLGMVSLLGVLLFRSRSTGGSGGTKGAPRTIVSPGGKALTGILAWIGILAYLTPHLNILFMSFADHRAWATELLPASFTVQNYVDVFRNRSALEPIWNSLWMSGAAAAGTAVIGLPAAYLIGRSRRGGAWVNVLVMIPWALPGTVVAMNMIVAFNDRWLPLYTTVFLLPIAYFVRFIPLWTRIAAAGITQFDATLIEAARTLGATPRHAFLRIVAPLLAPSLVVATALVFVSCLGEFVASILLYQAANKPIAIQINQEWRGSGLGAAFAYSVFLMVMVTATFAATRRFATRTI